MRAWWLTLMVVALAMPGGTFAAPGDDPAAKAMYEQALKADLAGDALAAQDLLLALAVAHPGTRHGRAARMRLGGSGASATAVVGILAAVAIPAFVKYTKRAKTAEATMRLRQMFDGAVAFYNSEQAGPDGRILPHRFPHTTQPTPAVVPCGVKTLPTNLDQPGWRDLGFEIHEPTAYQFTFVSEGTGRGARFTARATGDLNCDGVLSTFERVGTIDEDGNVSGGAGLFRQNELE
jgi:type II secretory pathway pseudopilin PulG